MKPKSLKVNMVLNVIRGVLNVVFPLITYPYASRLLGVEQLGRVDFSQSIINYILLLAGLGFANYAIREGSPLRDKRDEMSRLSSEIFTLNIISSLISYLVLFAWIALSSKLKGYTVLILILSVTVILKAIGVEWLFTIYEDYLYITVRSIIFQIVSIIALFLFVKDYDDLYLYAAIMVFSSAGSFVMNFFRAKRFVNLRLIFTDRMKSYMKPVMIFFAMTAFQTIYVSCDTTILGYISGDYYVGLYGVSTKIYLIIKSFLSSAIVVSLPRLCKFAQENDTAGFRETASEVMKILLFLVFPAVVGIIFFHKEMILIISSKDFLEAGLSLVILSFSLFSSLLAYFWAQCVLISFKREKLILVLSIVSAAINIILNLILIPFFDHNAAAFTTIVSESFIAFASYLAGRRYVKLMGIWKQVLTILPGCGLIAIICLLAKRLIGSGMVAFVVGVVCSVIGYFALETVLKNEVMYPVWAKVKGKLSGRKQGGSVDS